LELLGDSTYLLACNNGFETIKRESARRSAV
jgi:hypothetical protein